MSRWTGRAATTAGLSGSVSREQLERHLSGADPESGELLTGRDLKVPAYDLTFSPPKSVSLLWGTTTDPAVGMAVVEAHNAAVDAAVAWLEDEVVVARRVGGGTDRIATTGLSVAAFRHVASRAGDPQLHFHCLTAAAVIGTDDRTTALDGAAVYRASRLAGSVYQQTLRHQLSASLGVRWTATRNGQADLAQGRPRSGWRRWHGPPRVPASAHRRNRPWTCRAHHCRRHAPLGGLRTRCPNGRGGG